MHGQAGNGARSDAVRCIQQALTLHREGRLREAEQIYGAVLAADPHTSTPCICAACSPSARPLGGSFAAGRRRAESGAALAGRAVNYGVILDALKRHEEALEISKRF